MCEHNKFEANVQVNRITSNNLTQFAADVSIRCADCLLPFSFLGLPRGLLPDKPTSSFSGYEARMPIYPGSQTEQKTIDGKATVILTKTNNELAGSRRMMLSPPTEKD